MTLIEIDKTTIKRNPNAGRTTYFMPMGIDAKGDCDGELPAFLEDIAIPVAQQYENGELVNTEFVITGALTTNHIEAVKHFRKPRITLNIEYRHIVSESMFPEPTYHYEYLNPLVPCDNCGKDVRYNSIETVDDNEGYDHDKCPYCKDIDTFEYKRQSINDAIKQHQLTI